jgi:hypothetical protein
MNIQSTGNIPLLVQPRQERGDQTLGFGRDTTGAIVYRLVTLSSVEAFVSLTSQCNRIRTIHTNWLDHMRSGRHLHGRIYPK